MPESTSIVAACLDCHLPYEDFPLDVILPRSQWLEIHPDDHGLLCAQCIVKRASKIPGILCVLTTLEFVPSLQYIVRDQFNIIARFTYEAQALLFALEGEGWYVVDSVSGRVL